MGDLPVSTPRTVAWRVRVALGVVVVAALGAASLGVRVEADPTAHFPRGSPAVAAWLELSLRFDAFNTLLVGLEEPSVALTPDGLRRVKRITDRLAGLKAKGVLAVASVTNVESIHEGDDGSLETEPLVPAIPGDGPGLEALAKKISADAQVSGALISRDQRGYLIVLRADPRRDAAELGSAILAVVEEERGPLVASCFGAPFFQASIVRALVASLGWLAPLSLILLLGALGLTVRSAPRIALVLAGAGLSLVVWLGLVRVSALALTPPVLAVAPPLFALAALVFARCLEARAAVVAQGLGAVAAGALALLAVPSQATVAGALALGVAAIGLVAALLFIPLAGPVPPGGSPAGPRRAFLAGPAVAAIALLGAGLLARQLRVHVTPQEVFSASDEVGRAISFFDRRFGGSDVIQLDFRGDLREPELAARLLRLTELLEDPSVFPDVRAVAPVLAMLSHGFGGVPRIPTSRESLNNLWFFLEGRPDVRGLVSDRRDEAVVVLRVPSKLPRPPAELAALVEAAVAGSLEQGRAATRARLVATARVHRLPVADLDAVLDAPAVEPRQELSAALKKWLGSGESPYQPTEAQWLKLAEALEAGPLERGARLAAAAAQFTELQDPANAAQLVESVLAREKDLSLALRSMALAERLWPTASLAAKEAAQGIFADHLDPHSGPGAAATVTVSGLPLVAEQVERDSLTGLWRALALLVAGAAAARLVLTRELGATARVALEAALATAGTAAAGALGLGADPGSTAVYLLPPLAVFLASDSTGPVRVSTGFALALAAACLPLVFTGSLPVMRIGAGLAAGLLAVVLVRFASRRAGAPGSPRGSV